MKLEDNGKAEAFGSQVRFSPPESAKFFDSEEADGSLRIRRVEVADS